MKKDKVKQFNITFTVFDKVKRRRIVKNTWIVTEETYNEVMDLLRSKQKSYMEM